MYVCNIVCFRTLLLNFVMGVWPHLKVLLAKWAKDENIVHVS